MTHHPALAHYASLFSVDVSLINFDAFFNPAVKDELQKNGFVIVRNAIPTHHIMAMRTKWLEHMAASSDFTTDVMLGKENYVHNFFGKYKRAFDFYWNAPSCALTRDISLLLHFARNIIIGDDPYFGLTFSPDRTGVYLAVTHYPEGSGEMAVHVDPNYFLPVHFNVALTFKGLDYKEGGLYVKPNENTHIDVDGQIQAGDVLLFNGSVPHGIGKVQGAGTQSAIGRVQMFSIPTQFTQKKPHSLLYELAFEIKGRLKYMSYKAGRGLRSDYKNFR